MVNIYNNMAKSLKINNRLAFTQLNIFQNNYFITHKKYVSVLANELRSGNIFFHNDKYCEVTEQRQIKQGRLATTNMSSSVKFACQAKVDKIEPVKVNVHIQYTDKQKNIVVCLDQNYEDVEIPMNIFGVSEEYLEPGMEISVFKHEDKIIKVNLPSSLLATLRKK
ncbi:conserved Plasmodium protein, unknown function [Plasmodium vinckei]|uniref:Translation elongation factor P/YeiP central domain-containing protein n=1 Tax=Plasmodium vinckei TaxID=5860 RepID=A0A6V7SUM3_PLAVN|nr:conserved Plasmodium protein, unknown function [Plasmodium vinckei]